MRKVNRTKTPAELQEEGLSKPIASSGQAAQNPWAQPAAAQSDSQAPSSLTACHSSDDLARYLHTLGWRGILDQEWTNLPLLWEEIKELRS